MFQVPLAGQSINSAQIGIETNISSSSATIGNASITNATVGQLSTTIFAPQTVTTNTLDANIGTIGTLSVSNPIANLRATELNCCVINSCTKNVCNVSCINLSANQITCDNLQPLLTAGTNVTIVDNVISAANTALLPSVAGFHTVNSSIVNSSFFVSNQANMFHTSTVSISSNHASFVALTANNLSTGDINFGSNLSYNGATKHLDVNTTGFVTENDERPVTSWGVYKEFVNRLTNQVNNIMTVHLFRLDDPEVTLVASQVAAGQNNVIFRVDFTPQYEGSKIAVEVCYAYRVGGNGTDNVTTDLQIGMNSNSHQLVVQRIEQNWTNAGGGGTRGGDAGSIMGVYNNADPLGAFHRVQLKVYNFTDDLWQLESITYPAIKITEILEIDTVNNPNIRIGEGNISCGNLSCTRISVANFIVEEGDITTTEGLNAGGGLITTGFKPDGTVAALSRIRMGSGNFINYADETWDGTTFNISLRQANKNLKVSISGVEYLQVNVSNTSTRDLQVNGNLNVTGSINLSALTLNGVISADGGLFYAPSMFEDNVSIHKRLNVSNVSITQGLHINGNISAGGTMTLTGNFTSQGNVTAQNGYFGNLSTASLQASQNISILNGSISAYIQGGNDIDVRNLHVDEGVDVIGILNVCQTSNFEQSLNVCNILYAGKTGQHDGSIVVYSQEVGKNWATKFDDDKLNMSATGTATEANIWVGGNKTLSITPTGVNISGTITANQFNFSLDNISITNLSSVNITGTSITAPNVQETLIAGVGINISGNVISGTETLVAGQNISIFNNVVSTTPNINVSNLSTINGSFSALTCSGNISFPIGQFLYRDFTGLLNVSEGEIENIILGDLALSFKSAQINASKLNVSNISFTGIGGGTLDMGGFGTITKVSTINTLNLNASQINASNASIGNLSATNITATSISASNLSTASLGLSSDLYILSNVLYVDFTSATDAATAEVNSLASALATNVSTTSVSATFGTIGLLTINTLASAPTINVSTLNASNISANSITAPNVQEKLIAGTGINISGTTISALQTLTAGNNLQIIANEISTTTTINSSVHNATTMNTSILNTSDIDAPMGEIDNLSSINFSATNGTIDNLSSTTGTITTLTSTTQNTTTTNTSTLNASTIATNSFSVVNAFNTGQINSGLINASTLNSSNAISLTYNAGTINGSGVNGSTLKGNNISVLGTGTLDSFLIRSTTTNANTLNCSDINVSNKVSCVNMSLTNISSTLITTGTIRATTSNGTTMNASNINISTKIHGTNLSITNISATEITATTIRATTSNGTTMNASNLNISTKLTTTNISATNISATSITASNVQPTLTAGSGINITGTTISTTQTLVAGNNIQIIGNDILTTTTINSSVHTASSMNTSILNTSDIDAPMGEIDNLSSINISATNITATSITAPNVQPTLIAGTNISIVGTTISAIGSTITAGNNISILNDVVSLTPNINISNVSVINLSATNGTITTFKTNALNVSGLTLLDSLSVSGPGATSLGTDEVTIGKSTAAGTQSYISYWSPTTANQVGLRVGIFNTGFASIELPYYGQLVNRFSINISNASYLTMSNNSTRFQQPVIFSYDVTANKITSTNICNTNLSSSLITTGTIRATTSNGTTMNASNLNISTKLTTTNISATNITATSITAPNVQPTLIAGTNISIVGTTISATGGSSLTAGTNISILNDVVSLTPNISVTNISATSITASNVQPTLTAGTGIQITGTTISTTLTAGNNLQIIGNDISTTTTINSSVHTAGTMNTSILNTSDIDSILGEIDNLSSINISATNITATSITASNVQPTLTAGTGINISNNVISTNLTAGSNISILNNIVSLNPNINISNLSVINGSFSALTCTGNISFPIGFALYRDFTGLLNVCDIQIKGLFGSTFSTTTGNFSKINVSNVSFTGLGPKMSMGGLGEIFGVGTYTGLNLNVSKINASNISSINGSFTNITGSSIVAANVQPTLTTGNNIQIISNVISTSSTINTSNINVSTKVHTTNLSTTNFSGDLGTFSGALTIGGALTLTNQPRFLAYYQGPTAPLVVNVNVVLGYNTVKYNIGGGTYNTTSFQYTIPQTGYYEFYCSFFTHSTTSDVYLERNGTSIGRYRTTGTTAADSTRYIVVQTICNVNDTIRCICRQNSIRLSPLGTLHQGIHQFGGFRFA